MKKKEEDKIKKEEEKPVKIIKTGIPLHVFFSIKSIPLHKQEGMKFYNNAKELRLHLEEWEEFFKNY